MLLSPNGFIGPTFPTISLKSLQLQVTHRVTHQLATRVLAILLKEILDFEHIEIDNSLDAMQAKTDDEKVMEYATIVKLQKTNYDIGPAINLEVWVAPDSHVKFPDSVVQGGSLSDDLARYGLFIQESFGPKLYTFNDFIARSGSYSEGVKEFKLVSEMETILKKNVEKIGNFSGIFNSPKCISKTEP